MENDRFKFRVWDKAENKYNGFSFLLTMLGKLDRLSVDGDLLATDENRFIIEQCTGLKDKNGKLIFEGDIVKVVCGGMFEHEMTFEVVYGISRWQIRNCGNYKHYNKYHDLDIGSMFEIIGNIHDPR